MDVMREAFTLIPEYLRTPEDGTVRNLMDTGVQLGRRFRALKLWMILRSFGARALREHLERHISLARQFAEWVDAHPDFRRLAPVPLSVVCFRWEPAERGLDDAELDAANERLMNAVNATGEVFLSHTRIRGSVALRVAVGHLNTSEAHVRRAWTLLNEAAATLSTSRSSLETGV
jgi:aromatic-L-amino-acid decarboxylase